MELSSKVLSDNTIIFFLCDMQEKFRNVISYFIDIVEVANRMVKASQILKIPLIVTEQYPKGLGHTISEIKIGNAFGIYEKTQFSMATTEVDEAISKIFQEKTVIDNKFAVIFGVETHICILQSVIDLLKRGFHVFVIVDATSSRSQMDRLFAFQSLRSIGAHLTTSESLLFQLISDKNHPQFKEIQALIKDTAPTSGLLNSAILL